MVRARGLEPPILSEPDPKSGASAIPPRAREARMPALPAHLKQGLAACSAFRGISFATVLNEGHRSAPVPGRPAVMYQMRPPGFGPGFSLGADWVQHLR